MADEVYMDATVGGASLVESGVLALLQLDEELDAAAQVTIELAPDDAACSVLCDLVLGAKLSVVVGVGTSPTRTVACRVTETEDELDGEGRWRYTVRGVDDLMTLKQVVQSRLLEVSPQAALQQIASDHGWTASLDGIEAWTQPLLQNNESDAGFVRRLAQDFRYTLTLEGTTLRGGRALDSTKVTLDEDSDLIRLRVKRSLADIPSEVTVVGYDWKGTQAAVQGQAAATDLMATSGGKTGPALVAEVWGTVTLLVESERLLAEGDASALARGMLQARADRLVEGEVECLGTPDARPGRLLVLTDLGSASGTYRIRATKHVLDPSAGYKTTIWFYSDSLPPEGT